MAWIIWLAAFVILIGIEAATMALTTIWFAGGAIIAFLLALLGADYNVQMAAFFIISCALLFFTRPFALRFVNKKTVKTNVEGLIGKKARITGSWIVSRIIRWAGLSLFIPSPFTISLREWES